jgi:hypothetical protein
MEKVQAYFFSRAKRGVLLNQQNLKDYIRSRKIELSSKEREKLPYLRRKWKYIAMYTRPRRKIPAYMALAYPKYGVLWVDLANFRPDIANDNDGCGGKRRRDRFCNSF